VVVTADPVRLPDKATWYLVTNLPRPGSPRQATSPHPPAALEEIVRIYGLRIWIEQSYKQIKDELGWADFQVRSDIAIRRHQALVNCAFTFCWATYLTDPPPTTPPEPASMASQERGKHRQTPAEPATPHHLTSTQLAPHTARSPLLADPRAHAHTLVEQLVEHAPTH
jgi:hypothetical protein